MNKANKETPVFESCIECKGILSRLDRNEKDIQSIFKMLNGLLWKIALITGLIMGLGQTATIVTIFVNLAKVKP